jgi:FixJ family two-component response regulator
LRSLGWRFCEAHDRRRATMSLQRYPVRLVVAEAGFAPWPWQQLLDYLHLLPHPAQLIVTSRIADEALWADVLNRGGFDVLARPFDREELRRVVMSACRRLDDQRIGPARQGAARAARAV